MYPGKWPTFEKHTFWKPVKVSRDRRTRALFKNFGVPVFEHHCTYLISAVMALWFKKMKYTASVSLITSSPGNSCLNKLYPCTFFRSKWTTSWTFSPPTAGIRFHSFNYSMTSSIPQVSNRAVVTTVSNFDSLESLLLGRFHTHLMDVYAPMVIRYIGKFTTFLVN